MERLTRPLDEYECRIKDCNAEDWMKTLYGEYTTKVVCDGCPFMAIVNHLGSIEDYLEKNNISIKG